MAVTWDVPHSEFAAMVVFASQSHLRVWIYNMRNEATDMGMELWQLVPGFYDVRMGTVGEGSGFNRKYCWTSRDRFNLRTRADRYRISVPPRVETVVDLRLGERTLLPDSMPDPAIGPRDIRILESANGKIDIEGTVHNLGSRPVSNLRVSLFRGDPETDRTPHGMTLWPLGACRDFQPSTVRFVFEDIPACEKMTVVLDPEGELMEICETNNRISVSLE
jgi:hypothetical protein